MTADQSRPTLVEFLLARIAEDEEDEEVTHKALGLLGRATEWHRVEVLRERILAECEAKRRIVEGHTDSWTLGRMDYMEGVWRATDHIVRLLALPYADHPDYRQEWRP